MRSIVYGSVSAPHEISVFFDLKSEDSVLFVDQKLPLITEAWIDSQEVKITFRPYPVNQETLFFLFCYDILEKSQRQIFFELLMEMGSSTIESIERLLKMLIGRIDGVIELFEYQKPRLLEEARELTTKYGFKTTPVVFFDNFPLSNEEQDDLVHFLSQCQDRSQSFS
jgi:hypothetical protein